MFLFINCQKRRHVYACELFVGVFIFEILQNGLFLCVFNNCTIFWKKTKKQFPTRISKQNEIRGKKRWEKLKTV